jgi:putative transposase
MRKAYKTDLTDAQWELIQDLVGPARRRPGWPPVDLREVVNALLYQDRTGCQWELLPHDLPPKSTAFDYYKAWSLSGVWQRVLDRLRQKARVQAGKEPTPSLVILDSQSARTGPGGGEDIGTDGGKRVKGRQRHIAVDTLGLLLAVSVTAANVSDGRAAPQVLEQLKGEDNPRLKKVPGDERYNDKTLRQYLEAERPELELEVTGRPAQAKGFRPVRWRWAVERTFAWLLSDRRLARDYERKTWSSAARVRLAAIARLLPRVTRKAVSKTIKKTKVSESGLPAHKTMPQEPLRSG